MATYKYNDNSKQAINAIESATKRALTAGALFVQSQAVDNISHGDTKAVDTGRLRASLTYEVERQYALVGSNVEYAPFVELGTSRMSPRPFLRNAINNNKSKLRTIMASEYNKELK